MSLSALSGVSGLSGILPAVSAAIVPITNALTGGVSWVPSTQYADLQGQTKCSWRLTAPLTPTSNGTVIEYGGAGTGSVLYLFNGVVKMYAGSGGQSRTIGTNAIELLWTVPSSGNYLIEFSGKCVNTNMIGRLYINGVQVAESIATSIGSFSGGSACGLQGNYAGTANAQGGEIDTQAVFLPGTVTDCVVFPGQAIAAIEAYTFS